MTTRLTSQVIQHFRKAVLLQDGGGLTDGQLLGCFIEHRDETAFAALVKRHGPMVWGVCRRLLPHHDAEDAFQATFLVLVRKAASIMPREMVANWLYGVAHQTALHSRRTAARRRTRERQVTQMPEPAVAEHDLWHDLQHLLDQELARLPDKYRVAIVLCDLEGKTRKEAARQLGCPEGTLAARLARGRVMLAKRLARHGLAVSGGALAAALSQQAASAGVPTSVVSSTIKASTLVAAGEAAAAGAFPAKVAALTEGVMKAMLLTKLKIATVVVFLIAVVGVAAWAGGSTVATATSPGVKQANETAPPSKERANEKQPEKAKKEPDVLTPGEAIKQRTKEKLTVQFKAASVEVTPLDGLQIEGYNEGPFIRLKDGNKFSVLLRGPATYQIMRLGIDPAKHFSGKVIRVTGQVQPDNGKGPPFNIVVDDLNQFEVVTE
jgi:RNA polymerase sigma factor (sigma-70 family)